MNKKLLASLMAGVMLVNQGASLSAERPNQRGFWAENKNFIKGVLAGGVGTALAGTIAYLVHDCKEVLEVVEMEWPCRSDKSSEEYYFDLIEQFEKAYKSLREGKIVKIKKTALENATVLFGSFNNEKNEMKIVNQYMLGVTDESYWKGTKLCDFTLKAVSKNNNTLNIDFIVEPSKNEELSTSEGSSNTTSIPQTDVSADFSNSSCMSNSDLDDVIKTWITALKGKFYIYNSDFNSFVKGVKVENFKGMEKFTTKTIEDRLFKEISTINQNVNVKQITCASSDISIDNYKKLIISMEKRTDTDSDIMVHFQWVA